LAFLLQVKEGGNEPIKHGGCLGLGLAAMGTRRADVYEQLKFTLYQVVMDDNYYH
jgi:26S proteasome regulatory subunit N2